MKNYIPRADKLFLSTMMISVWLPASVNAAATEFEPEFVNTCSQHLNVPYSKLPAICQQALTNFVKFDCGIAKAEGIANVTFSNDMMKETVIFTQIPQVGQNATSWITSKECRRQYAGTVLQDWGSTAAKWFCGTNDVWPCLGTKPSTAEISKSTNCNGPTTVSKIMGYWGSKIRQDRKEPITAVYKTHLSEEILEDYSDAAKKCNDKVVASEPNIAVDGKTRNYDINKLATKTTNSVPVCSNSGKLFFIAAAGDVTQSADSYSCDLTLRFYCELPPVGCGDTSATTPANARAYKSLDKDCGTANQRYWEKSVVHNKKGTKEAYDFCKQACDMDAECNGFSLHFNTTNCYIKNIKPGQCVAPVGGSTEWNSTNKNWVFYSKQ